MKSSLDRGSSTLDWCETNYAFHPYIAEYANTISNCLFVLMPPLFIKLFEPYAKSINKGIRLIWILYAIIGLSSMYFHATLSFLGQMLDELAILWLFAVAYGMWVPEKYLPKVFRNDRTSFQKVVAVVSIFCTFLAWLFPLINSFALMSLGFPTFYMLFGELNRSKNVKAKKLGVKCGVVWLLAVGCWICDRVFCDHWVALGFDYLHAIFHVLIAYTSATILTLFAFFEATEKHPELHPQISFWPMESFEFAIPFVAIKNISPKKIFHDG